MKLPEVQAAQSCAALYKHGEVQAAIAACQSAEKLAEPQMPKINAILNRPGRSSPHDELYALMVGRANFVTASILAQISAKSDPKVSHAFALDAATWALLLQISLHHNEPTSGTKSDDYAAWRAPVNGYLKSLENFSPGILAEAAARKPG